MKKAFILGLFSLSCASSAAQYTAELEACLQLSSSCDKYVSCREQVAAKYGRKFDGYCIKDGGHDE